MGGREEREEGTEEEREIEMEIVCIWDGSALPGVVPLSPLEEVQ